MAAQCMSRRVILVALNRGHSFGNLQASLSCFVFDQKHLSLQLHRLTLAEHLQVSSCSGSGRAQAAASLSRDVRAASS